jgi:glycosyltransferase involved in cell wall biosynthesis
VRLCGSLGGRGSVPEAGFNGPEDFLKKILINGKFFCQQVTGTQRYARELLKQFDELISEEANRDIVVEVLVPRSAGSIPRYNNLRVRAVGMLSGTLWEQCELPLYCRRHLLVTLSGGAPILHSRNVITIHDVAVFAAPAGYSRAYKLWYQFLYKWMGRRACHILTVSQFSKSEIVKWCGTDPRRISVTYLGSDHAFGLKADDSALKRFGISGNFILSISSLNPNKNFHRVAEAAGCLNRPGLEFVFAGGWDRRVYREGVSLPVRIRQLGYVSDEELKALYQAASCFVFATLYEGFGLPALEALSCGCPVVASRAASLPELFEGSAVFCDPLSPKDIAAAIELSLQFPRSECNKLTEFARKYSWETCARKTLEVLKES